MPLFIFSFKPYSKPMMGLLAFVVALGVLRAMFSVIEPVLEHYPELVGAKLEYLREHRNEFDAVFIGTSRTYRNIDPTVFDEVVRTKRPGFTSFNFAAPAMSWLEQRYLIEELLSMQPERLKTIFIEPVFDINADHANALSERTVRYHRLRYLPNTMRFILDSDPTRSATENLSLINDHLQATLYNLGNVAALSNVFTKELEDEDQPKRLFEHRGFLSMDGDERGGGKEARGGFLNDPKFYQDHLAAALNDPTHHQTPHTFEFEKNYLNRVSARYEKRGVEVVFILQPSLSPKTQAVRELAIKNEIKAPVLSFADPRLYPKQFELSNRWDNEHLNEKAALEFSSVVADRF